MDIARSWLRVRSCIKRKVAAIIVRDKRVISTGYNGTPRGVRNCNEGGCPRCNSLAASTKLDECLCSHGEENAIVQASYHGVAQRRDHLHHICAMPHVREDDHQLGIREVISMRITR
jgi:dCMP deaminase